MKTIYYKSLIVFVLIAFALLSFIIFLNYYGDGGNRFFQADNFENKLADSLLKNNSVFVCVNYNDRNIKKILLNKLKTSPAMLVLGSSRTMSLTSSLFSNLNFFNGSVTSANMEDDIALYYLFERRGWKPKTVLIGLDPWILNKSNGSSLWKATFLYDYGKASRQFFGNKENLFQPYAKLSAWFENIIPLLSSSYLRSSIQNFIHKGDLSFKIIKSTQNQPNDYPGCHLHLPDGTRLTSKEDESNSSERADYAGAVEMHHFSSASLLPIKDKMQIFEKFIAYLLRQGIKIIFYLPPYEPTAYSVIQSNPNYKMIQMTEDYFRASAAKYHIKIIGSYNPVALNLHSNDFIDEVHLKQKGINKIFKR
ncbi:MAG: hypothetical protein A3F11_02920 [Gammaproteobacteria bacterium RIFCSPHIGHO2_12_FULL_37_14]|nr:MAG: hypothetical protein A3F11_02920 [Gammaproteobacteria bacterium RIFCSPHIGHO2_12_FULL_37_14]